MRYDLSTLLGYLIQAAILLASIGAINWGLVHFVDFNVVTALLEALPLGELTESFVYALIFIGGLLGLTSFFDLEELAE